MKKTSTSRASIAESKIRPVSKVSISDEIVQQIMSLIANGDLKPGSRLPSERELCKKFGAGRSSLREALRCLSIVGVLTARVGEGTSVALDGEKFLGKIVEWRLITEQHDIENLMEVRIALEGVAAAQAARHAQEEDIDKLHDLLSKMESAIENDKKFAALDLEFHVTLARASDNTLLYDLITVIRGQLARGLSRVLPLPNALPLSLKEHVIIMQAIERRDPEASSEAMHKHLQNALARYEKAVAEEQRGTTNVKTKAAKTKKKTA